MSIHKDQENDMRAELNAISQQLEEITELLKALVPTREVLQVTVAPSGVDQIYYVLNPASGYIPKDLRDPNITWIRGE